MTTAAEAAAYDYELPAELIAQHPAPTRDASRLLVLDRASGDVAHRHFPDVLDLMMPGDLLVLNTSKVMRARLHGRRESGAPAELLLVQEMDDGQWLAMGSPGGKLKPGRTVEFGPDAVAEVVDVLGGGLRQIRWLGRLSGWDVMDQYGEIPLPPYIRRAPNPDDAARYQTVFADQLGSAAAPTAGLHFTEAILATVQERGVRTATLELAIGPGTFKPVDAKLLRDHVMHKETFDIPVATADAVAETRHGGGACWAVGTTVVRALESAVQGGTAIRTGRQQTDLFIHPPYQFKVVDHLLTNFHLPRSTLLMLVAAFGGHEQVMGAYKTAVQERYRFYSYGDAMVII